MEEFSLVDRAMHLFETSSGCRLHRDPASKKCKFLPLSRWRGTLQQSDIPCSYMTISDHLDMLGRGGQKNTKVEFQLACKLIPSTRLSHFQKHKAHLWDPPGSASSGCHFSRKIYKGNSEKYKGKIRKQDISVFEPKHNVKGCLRWLAAFLRS